MTRQVTGCQAIWYESSSCPGMLTAMIKHVLPRWPEQADVLLSEGFCPDCLVPLGGTPCTWCPECTVSWHFRPNPAPGASDETTAQAPRLS